MSDSRPLQLVRSIAISISISSNRFTNWLLSSKGGTGGGGARSGCRDIDTVGDTGFVLTKFSVHGTDIDGY